MIQARLENFFDKVYIDEVQDFWGYDFDFLNIVSWTNLDVLLVWDFYQHTFDTSRDGSKWGSLYADYSKYIKWLKGMEYSIDTTTLIKSHRCSKNTCDFVRNNLWIGIYSSREDITTLEFIDDTERIKEIFADQNIVKLFYQKHSQFDCRSNNWWASKWIDKYEDVCVVLNKTTFEHFQTNTLTNLKGSTKNKFYVACTRARRNLYFISELQLKELI